MMMFVAFFAIVLGCFWLAHSPFASVISDLD